MVWEVLLYLYVLYSPDWHYRSTMPIFLFVYGLFFAAAHSLVRFELAFKLHYAALLLLCTPRMYKYYIHTTDLAARRLAQLFVSTLLLGSLCWLADRFLCKELTQLPVNPQGHALWHVCMGFNSYFANTFLMFCRAQQLGWRPRIFCLFGILPYVHIDKSDSRPVKPKPE